MVLAQNVQPGKTFPVLLHLRDAEEFRPQGPFIVGSPACPVHGATVPPQNGLVTVLHVWNLLACCWSLKGRNGAMVVFRAPAY